MTYYRIPLSDLRFHVYPLDGQMWRCGEIDPSEIFKALNENEREHRCWGTVVNTMTLEDARLFHIRRIATLMDMPCFDRIVVIAETHLNPPKVYLNDGNHRLAAAYLRKDEFIDAIIATPQEGSVLSIFPNATPI
jgi:hypothetical protein